MRFNFSSPLGIGRVTGKYTGVGDGDGETRLHPAPLPCLLVAAWAGHILPLQSGMNCNLLTTETSCDLTDKPDT